MSTLPLDILSEAANVARGLAIDAVHKCSSGHLGLPLGAAEIGAALFGHALTYNPADPKWLNRDRFILSAGHGSMFLYAWLHLSGYDLSLEEVKNFRQLHSKTAGHPEVGITPGVETTTGPLGQGITNAVGMALAEKLLAAEFNRRMSVQYESIRDFIVLHYHVNERTDSALWKHVREMNILPTLRHRIDLFRQTARVFRPSDELFAENSWVQVMMGQGIIPQRYHPVADLMGPEELNRFLNEIHLKVQRIVAGLPTHQTYVQQLCAPYRKAA